MLGNERDLEIETSGEEDQNFYQYYSVKRIKQQMITGGKTWQERTSPKVKKHFVQEQIQSIGNKRGEGKEVTKMWEENGIVGNENVTV